MKSKELSGRGGMKLVKSYERVYELEISTMLLKISITTEKNLKYMN